MSDRAQSALIVNNDYIDGHKQILVKFMAKGHRSDDHEIWLRQLPAREPVWGQCRFIFDQEAREYDWLVVYDDLAPVGTERFSVCLEKLPCPREQTIFVTAEPSSVKIYGNGFLSQFGYVLTGQEPQVVHHAGLIHSQPALRWFYGMPFGKNIRANHAYDDLAAVAPFAKVKSISTVCSSKQMTHTLHQKRYNFTQRLKTAMPELDVFGHGVRPVDDKAEALDPYCYHIAIENHISVHHWTEKLSDAFLGYTLPLYYGCPNAGDYFPENSFIPIDIDDFEGTVKLIRQVVTNNEYEKRFPAIIEARRRVLEEYNLFAVLAAKIQSLHPTLKQNKSKQTEYVYGRHIYRRKHPIRGLLDLAEKIYYKGRY